MDFEKNDYQISNENNKGKKHVARDIGFIFLSIILAAVSTLVINLSGIIL
ncbi:MAG: hypothetical protein IJR66_01100 [Clostridia bacterium]|nr:hypothetical protein [Clostridia bacterium]